MLPKNHSLRTWRPRVHATAETNAHVLLTTSCMGLQMKTCPIIVNVPWCILALGCASSVQPLGGRGVLSRGDRRSRRARARRLPASFSMSEKGRKAGRLPQLWPAGRPCWRPSPSCSTPPRPDQATTQQGSDPPGWTPLCPLFPPAGLSARSAAGQPSTPHPPQHANGPPQSCRTCSALRKVSGCFNRVTITFLLRQEETAISCASRWRMSAGGKWPQQCVGPGVRPAGKPKGKLGARACSQTVWIWRARAHSTSRSSSLAASSGPRP